MEMKPNEAKLSVKTVVRMTKSLARLVDAEARERNESVSETMRSIMERYFEEKFSDLNLLNSSMAQVQRKIGYLENKVELCALISLELAKNQIRNLPERPSAGAENERRYERFLADCASSLKGRHRGVLEGMVLDLYERSAGEDS